MTIAKLRESYEANRAKAERFSEILKEQLQEIFLDNAISLGVPIETRVKKWGSIEEKLKRKSLDLTDSKDLSDLVGLRVILLFKRDLMKSCNIIEKTFVVTEKEDVSDRLDETQFGYQSIHYVMTLPKKWLAVPSFKDYGNFKAELQIRTLAQHIWAAASHDLQYKQESSVPPPVRRAIHRASALLETVDLEFERVLQDREAYIATAASENTDDQVLNVDLLVNILDNKLPLKNKTGDDAYAELLLNLSGFGINKTRDLLNLIDDHIDAALAEEASAVQDLREKKQKSRFTYNKRRTDEGVFFSHIGLVRAMLDDKYGSWKKNE